MWYESNDIHRENFFLNVALILKLRSVAARGHPDQMSFSDSIECVCVEL